LPAGIVTDPCTAAAGLSLLSFTTKPDRLAGKSLVTVPVTVAPPFTRAGFTESVANCGFGKTVRFALNVTFASFATITTFWFPETGEVCTTTLAELFPAGIVTDAGNEIPA